MDSLVLEARPKFQKALDHFNEELKTIRTGRANAALVEDVVVTHYNQTMSIKQLATISTPDAKTITISPWDQTATAAIEKALAEDKNLGLNPVSDGRVIHVAVPPLTSERREQMAKQINEKSEQCFIAMRNIRHEAINDGKKLVQAKEATEDDARRLEKQLNDLIDDFKKQVEAAASAKQAEIREI